MATMSDKIMERVEAASGGIPDTPLTPRGVSYRRSAAVIFIVLLIFYICIAVVPDNNKFETANDDITNKIDTGSTAWMLCSTALVLFMTPGLAFFYAGMVRSKNVIACLMQSFICMGIISIIWVVWGYSMSFADGNHVYGNPGTFAFYANVGAEPNDELAPGIPHTVFASFELMFAMITPALVSGAFAERVNFVGWCCWVVLFHTLIYCPLAHMVWTPHGLLHAWRTVDFAGGTVVHMSSGWSALMGAWYLGPGKEPDRKTHSKANVPYVILGASMLWFGWFGFNAGSALTSGALAGHAFMTTNTATATAMITWVLLDLLKGKRPGACGACAGAVVGLVVITPACGFVTNGGAACCGVIGAVVCSSVQELFEKSHNIEDTLDVFPCHGTGGTMGMLLTGCFANRKVNPSTLNGLFYGGSELFYRHIVSLIGIVTYIVLASTFTFFIIDKTIGLRVPLEQEQLGLDLSMHGESTSSDTLAMALKEDSLHNIAVKMANSITADKPKAEPIPRIDEEEGKSA